jgi:hypothetical protein
MTFKILTAVALTAVVGLASATSSTEEVRMLEAKLFAAKAKFAADSGGDRGARADTRTRFVRETETIFTLAEKVKELDALMTALEQTQDAQLSSVPGSIKGLEVSINAAITSVKRVDGMNGDISDLDAEVDMIPENAAVETDIVATKMVKLQSDMTALSADVTKKNTAALAAVDAKIAASQKATEASSAALARSVLGKANAAKALAAKASGDTSTYVHWGSKECKGGNGVKKAYHGWTYATYHDHRGGSTPQCLIDAGGDHGGRHGGWDSLDWLYASRLNNCGGTAFDNNGKCNKNVPCSVCTREVQCYVESGTPECSAEGYEAQYKGWLYGSERGHNSKHERICIDDSGDGWGPDNGSGSYFYPTLNNNKVRSRQSDVTIKCQFCCRKP